MTDSAANRREPRLQLVPIPQSTFLIWINLAVALVVGAIGFAVGFVQGLSAQDVILSTVISVAVLLWLLNYVAVIFETRRTEGAAAAAVATAPAGGGGAGAVWRENRLLILAMAGLLLLYLIVVATVPSFRTVTNLIAFLVLEAILLFAFKVSGQFQQGRSAFIGLIVLGALVVISAFTIEGFLSAPNIRAILLFAAFLGIACIGQTLVALMGGLDLSIPFVIGSANIGLMFLITLGVPAFVALGFVLVITEGFGAMNMGRRAWDIFRALEGRRVALSGATQVRAGVIRPEVVAAPRGAGSAAPDIVPVDAAGARVRVVRGSRFGDLGVIRAAPATPGVLATGALAAVFEVELDSGERISLPRSNVEAVFGPSDPAGGSIKQ